jgi:hypothetical protein
VATVDDLYCTKIFRGLWIKLLILEGRQDAIKAALTSVKIRKHQAIILSSFLAAEVTHGRGLRPACQQLLDLKTAIPSLPLSTAIRPILSRLPFDSDKIPTPLYDQLLPLLGNTSNTHFNTAAFTLFHPTQPTSSSAYEFFQSLSDDATVEPYTKHSTPRHLMISMSLRLAHLLIDEGRLKYAQEILDFAQKYFPEALGGNATMIETSKVAQDASPSTQEQRILDSLQTMLAT